MQINKFKYSKDESSRVTTLDVQVFSVPMLKIIL